MELGETFEQIFAFIDSVNDSIHVQALVSGPKGIESQPDTARFLSSLNPVGS